MKPAKASARTPRDPAFLTAALVAAGALLQGSAAVTSVPSASGKSDALSAQDPVASDGSANTVFAVASLPHG